MILPADGSAAREVLLPRCTLTGGSHRTIDPHTLKIPAPPGAESTLTENASSPFHAEPRHLHVLLEGDSAVLESENLYCYRIENSQWIENPACRLEKFDLTTQDFAYCAPSFSEFLYRFWIENEIWFASYEKTLRPRRH